MSDPVDALIQRTRTARGMAATITDPATLAKVAALLAGRSVNDEGPPKRAFDSMTSSDATTKKACRA